MKHIKKYSTGSEFTQNGNILDFTYYVFIESKHDDYLHYDIVDSDEGDETLQCKGSVKEITPGVAYVVDSGTSFYNGSFPKIDFQYNANQTYPWSDFGITEEIYSNYVKKVKAFAHPSELNITMGTTPITGIEWYGGDEEETGFITFSTADDLYGVWLADILADGTVHIHQSTPK